MSGSTPAPWHLHPFAASYSVVAPIQDRKPIQPDVTLIATVKRRRPGQLGDPHADAHLIAAAPELLAALRGLLGTDGHVDRCRSISSPEGCIAQCAAARAAIALAISGGSE